ncbi:MAG: hypothetical protein ACR2HY_02230 [Acidimicrobiales bacterium]
MSEAGLHVEISPEETHDAARASAIAAILAHPRLRQHFPAGDLWVVAFDVVDKGDGDGARFTTVVHDTDTGRAALVEGWLDDLDSPFISPTANQWPPTEDEHAWAVSILAEHRDFSALMADPATTAYRPMPPLANVEHPDGTVDRVVAVGIRTAGDVSGAAARHRMVGVRTRDGEVLAELAGVAAPSEGDCGCPPGPSTASHAAAPPGPAAPPAGPSEGDSQARVQVRRGDTALWDLVVVRPRDSSGTNGSGVELRTVDYRGQRVLFRAHLPIVNVAYNDVRAAGGCGPTTRAWLREESCFGAEGIEAVTGFRLCPSAPETILDSGVDGGHCRGVALWLDGEELVITSQMQAGWYRYVSEWRLAADGTIRPRFGVAAARNPCTCMAQAHHTYWRLDFDIGGPDNNVIQEHNDPPVMAMSSWHTIRQEVRRTRSIEHGRYWRVRNTRASQGYAIRPGPADGTADDYGAGDLWVLRYHPEELDDGQGLTSDPHRSRAGLDRFLTGESVERQDLVVWYGAHLATDADPPDGSRRVVGPDLVPYQWKDAPTPSEAYAPLQPPTSEELRPPDPAT